MYINALMKYQYIRATCFGRKTSIIRRMQNIYPTQCTLILYLVYVLQWPDDGSFTAETCRHDIIDISLMR